MKSTVIDQPPIGPFASPRPSMQGRYLIRNQRKARLVHYLDQLLLTIPKRQFGVPVNPKRILVANWGHLGDVITTFGALALLRDRFPSAQIGMIVGSWGLPAISPTNLVDFIHVIDHWNVSRSKSTKVSKWIRYWKTQRSELRDIRGLCYEIGIDFYPFFPPAHPLFFRAGIPMRVGWTSGGFGSLLTHPVDWNDAESPIADHYRHLMSRVDPDWLLGAGVLQPRGNRKTLAPLPTLVAAEQPYIVIHPGAGAPTKDWGTHHWVELIRGLCAEYSEFSIVVTGAGESEFAVAESLSKQFPFIINMCGKVNWESFVSIIAGAILVVCPDTATGHVAALFDVPSISIFTGTNKASHWGPYSEKAQILSRPVLCSPCNRVGCDVMECIRGVSVDDVLSAIRCAV